MKNKKVGPLTPMEIFKGIILFVLVVLALSVIAHWVGFRLSDQGIAFKEAGKYEGTWTVESIYTGEYYEILSCPPGAYRNGVCEMVFDPKEWKKYLRPDIVVVLKNQTGNRLKIIQSEIRKNPCISLKDKMNKILKNAKPGDDVLISTLYYYQYEEWICKPEYYLVFELKKESPDEKN